MVPTPKIIFWGTPEFALPSLAALAAAGYELLAAVTKPNEPGKLGEVGEPSPVCREAEKLGIPVLKPQSLNDEEFSQSLESFAADLFIVAAYGKIIPPRLLALPKQGALNLHPSLLPKYRGATPIEAAILTGEAETGVSLILMDNEMDHGPIIAQAKIPIAADDTGITLSHKLAECGAELLKKTLPRWLEGSIEPTPQDHTKATFTRPLRREDGKLDWAKPAALLERQIRGYERWPSSYTFWQRGGNRLRLKIEKVRVVIQRGIKKPGEVWQSQEIPLGIAAGENTLQIFSLQPEGARSLSAREFLNGHPDIIGAILL